jgi:hypothetical protein
MFSHPALQEVDFLKGRDAGKGKIDFVDIASPSYSAADNAGVTFEQVGVLVSVKLLR